MSTQLLDVRGARFSVLGLARSGLGAANALASRGANVLISDLRDENQLGDALEHLDPHVEVVLGENRVREGDRVIISPGIRPGSPTFRLAHERGSEVWSEVELFWRLSPAPMLAVTGTDGKSTTTVLLGEMLRAAGRLTVVGGNLGNSLTAELDELTRDHAVVAELSCFQLIHCPTLRPRVAVYTNIAVDHVDYHGSYEAYQEAKRSLTSRMTPDDTIVWNADNAELSAWRWPDGPTRWTFSRRSPQRPGLALRDGVVLFTSAEGRVEELLPASQIRIPGPHNLENAMAAAGAAIAFGVDLSAIREALRRFPGLEHRIEHVAPVDGVTYYNDSKATNPHAALAGLGAFGDAPLVVIAGGSEKGSDFSEFGRTLAERARGVVLIGQTGQRIADAIPNRGQEGAPAVVFADDIAEAIRAAHELSQGEGVVTLCPACASFGMFTDYEDRGRRFKAAVRAFAVERGGA